MARHRQRASKDRRSVSGVSGLGINLSHARARVTPMSVQSGNTRNTSFEIIGYFGLDKADAATLYCAADCNDRNPVRSDRKSGADGNKPHINAHTILNCMGLDFAHKKTPARKREGKRAGATKSLTTQRRTPCDKCSDQLCSMWLVARQGCSGWPLHRGDLGHDTLRCGTGDQGFLNRLIGAEFDYLFVEPRLCAEAAFGSDDAGVAGGGFEWHLVSPVWDVYGTFMGRNRDRYCY